MAKAKADQGFKGLFKRVVAVFATFFIVIGVALVGLLARDTMPELVEEIGMEATSTDVYIEGFLKVDNESASLYKMDGEFVKSLSWPDDTNIFDRPVSQLRGVDVMSGEDVWLTDGFKIATTTEFRSPDGRRELSLESARRDGSRPLIVKYGNDRDVRILRNGGNLIKDIELIGWVSDKKLVFIGNATGTKAFLMLDLTTDVSYITPVLANGWSYKVFDNAIYFIDSDLNDEGQRVAPSFLYSVRMDGEISVLVQEFNSVIQTFALGQSRIIYALADQTMIAQSGRDRIEMGKCLPLMIIDEFVVCRAGDAIELRSEGVDPKSLFEAGDEGLFYLPKVRIDELLQNE